MQGLMAELAERDGYGAKALTFAILTAARSGEVRGATWSEIDEQEKLWVVPAARMKAGKEHRVPLSDTALTQLAERRAPEDLVFPGGKPMSDMTLAAVLKRMGLHDITAHGFRSSFRDWAGETTNFPREVIEAALAH
jgi:integrase